ncbi:MAG: hypothetical protein LQ341_003088 [Variospora aurantia]|nr:MAG: hypothetical protein LQ341_003088 [Variospora aurantia]
MATSLAAQLTQIRAHSTNALDTKAQKKAHSTSLLFDSHYAAAQDYNTLYQLCQEGWHELCRLDSRFLGFADNLFSEQSKLEERTQMTAAQNQNLDVVLEDFMGLVGARLLLKPALKAIEWLIRRFRSATAKNLSYGDALLTPSSIYSIHEHNTTCLILTFLPYHTSPVFLSLLTILPERRHGAFKFLQPYIQSSSIPSRHAIAYTAANNQDFFKALNTYTLRVCRCEQQYPALLSFWSSITSEAVSVMLDHSRLGRPELQKENQEDVLRRVMPPLAEGLAMHHSPDLRVGCYMILTVLGSKTNLSDELLAAMMEMVVHCWKLVTHAGLICLVIMAQQRHSMTLSRKVIKSLLAIEHLIDDLELLNDRYKVEKLVLGLILGILKRLGRPGDFHRIRTIRRLLEANLMQPSLVAAALTSMLCLLQDPASFPHTKDDFHTPSALADLIRCLSNLATVGPIVRSVLDHAETETRQSGFDVLRGSLVGLPKTTDVEMQDITITPRKVPFEDLVKRIPTQTAFKKSLLSQSESYIFSSLCDAFVEACQSSKNLHAFLELPVLRKSLASTELFFVSFFVRVWCGPHPIPARVAALNVLSNYLSNEKLLADVQLLLPYLIYVLADSSPSVRRAATEVVVAMAAFYDDVGTLDRHNAKLPILGKCRSYGEGNECDGIAWLPWQTVGIFLQEWLLPRLEECQLHAGRIGGSIANSLSAAAESGEVVNDQQSFKKSLRASVLTSLCSHVANTPIYAVKARLLPMLTGASKNGQAALMPLLNPILAATISRSQGDVEMHCEQDHVDASQYVKCVLEIATPNDEESIKLLQEYISTAPTNTNGLVDVAVFRRLRSIWPHLKAQTQITLAGIMLDLVLSDVCSQSEILRRREALDTLRKVKLSVDTLQSFLRSCPSLSDGRSTRGAKRRRIASPSHTSEADIRKASLILEVVESSVTKAHLSLLGKLTKLMADFQEYKQHSGIELHYLELLAMNTMRGILENSAVRSDSLFLQEKFTYYLQCVKLERNEIQVDVLVDSIRNSTDPQVQHTALLLVSLLASIAPELILHHVMPIFTFMGPTTMKRTDDYSSYVVKRTMDSVIPRIMDSLRKCRKDPISGVSELLLSFVAAFEHVPIERRLTLFRSLVEMIGVNEYLFALLLLLRNKFPRSKEALQFSIDLLSSHEVENQLQTADHYLATILDALSAKQTFSVHLLTKNHLNSSEEAVVDLLSHLILLLGDNRFVTNMSQAFAREEHQIQLLRSMLSHITNQTFSLSRRFPQTPTINKLCQKTLDVLLSGLPMVDLVTMLQNLLDSADAETRLDALKVFELRVGDGKITPFGGQEACLAFLPKLSSVIEGPDGETSRQVALACIVHIVERYGKKDIDAVVCVAGAMVSSKCLGAESEEVRVTSLLCLSTVIEVAQGEFGPFIPQTLQKALVTISNSIEEGTCSKRLHNAAYAFFSALLLHTPWAVAGTQLDLLLKVSHGSANANLDEAVFEERRATLELVARHIESKECCAALERTWANAMAEGPEVLFNMTLSGPRVLSDHKQAIKEQLLVLENVIGRSSKSAIDHQIAAFTRLLIKAFDLRRIQLCPPTENSYEEKEIEEVEDASNVAAIALVTRVNDKIFRPVFAQLVEWAATSSAKERAYRQTAVYGFFLRFFDRFKSVVTNYSVLIIEDAANILNKSVFTSETSKLLCTKVIKTLQVCFKHDQDGTFCATMENLSIGSNVEAGFWQTPSHFGLISQVLLNQLEQAGEASAAIEVTSAITELAVAADSTDHHRTFNRAVLQYMKSDRATVRLAAVNCQQNLTARLGEEWLALLPEMLPFISELQEDDDEKVERATLSWIKQSEEVLGESLAPMLQ